MKTAAVVRIIVFSIMAIVLTIVLVIGLAGGKLVNIAGDALFAGVFDSYENDESYVVGKGTFDADDIKEIELNWTAGKVNIEVNDGDQFELVEEYSGELSDAEKMRYRLEDGKLKVQYRAPGRFLWFNFKVQGKTLTLKVPESAMAQLDQLKVDAVSANVGVQGITANTFKCETISGRIELNDITCKQMEVSSTSGELLLNGITADDLDTETVSGKVTAKGSVKSFAGESVSGNLEVELSICPAIIKMNSVSGRITIRIPENDGFTAKYESVSGRFSSGEFAVTTSNKRVVYKNGEADFNLETVSGNILIEKLD